VEQNEKLLDIKLGSGPERADGGRDRGTGEGGRGRGERRGRGMHSDSVQMQSRIAHLTDSIALDRRIPR
jgi:hypothetical protein